MSGSVRVSPILGVTILSPEVVPVSSAASTLHWYTYDLSLPDTGSIMLGTSRGQITCAVNGACY
jgi:hypothetical protein